MPATTRSSVEGLKEHLSPLQLDSMIYADGKVNIWDGSIRAGKTVGSLLRWLQHVNDAPDGELIMVAKTVHAAYRNLFVPLMEMDPVGISYTPGAPMGKIWGRSVHVVGASDAAAESKIRGFTSAGAYVDEATLMPEDFWKTLFGRLSVPGSKLFATTNPDNPAHWLRRDILLPRSRDVRHFHFTLHDNPFLDPSYVEWIMRSYSGLYYKRFISGLWVAAEGAVYDMWDEDTMAPMISPEIQHWAAVGVDYGTKNPFHAVLLGVGVDRKLHVVSEYRHDPKVANRQKTDAQFADDLREFLAGPPGTRYKDVVPAWCVIDPSAASFRTELHQRGFVTYPGNNAVLDGIRVVSSLLSRGGLQINRRNCPGLVSEIPGYSWDDKAAMRGYDQPIKVADHGLDAIRYAVYTTRGFWQPLVDKTLTLAA